MDTKILGTTDSELKEAGKILAHGGLCAFPTETVYGLGADAKNPDAVARIYKAKGRPSDNPLIVHIADKSEIEKLTSGINENARALIDAFMPGPFTIILPKANDIPDIVTAGLPTVAIRFPENETARRLIKAAGTGIAAPSANISGKPSPTRAKHVIDDMSGKVDAIVNGGDCDFGVESTIVDASGEVPVLLRPGGITYDEIKKITPDAVIDSHILKSVGESDIPLCPGMKYKHYAPNAQVIVVEGDMRAVKSKIDELLLSNSNKTCGVLTMSDNAYDSAIILCGGTTNRSYAKNLFAALREFDKLGVDIIFAEFEPRDGYALAVKNRLYKSAAQNIIYV